MIQEFSWGNDEVSLTFKRDANDAISLVTFRSGLTSAYFPSNLPLIEILSTDTGHWIANDRLVQTELGRSLRYKTHTSRKEGELDSLTICLEDIERGLDVDITYELIRGSNMLRSFSTITNTSESVINLESVTGWSSLFGAPEGKSTNAQAWELLEADFDWLGEGRWKTERTATLFPNFSQHLTNHLTRGEYRVSSTGTWSTGKHAPLAMLQSESLGLVWLFQIEHNGAWRWEIGDYGTDGYLALSGPTCVDHGWLSELHQGESFTTVPVSVLLNSSFDGAIADLTAYRRSHRYQHRENTASSVIFNDYMNTINGDPTTEKLLPLIKAAAEVGVEIFVIDCGWYDDSGDWWPSVGEWLPSKTRFPNGITEVIDSIKDHGMIPGIWLEPEVVGVDSPVAQRLPESSFFRRNGKRVVEQKRYLLDFQDSSARNHIDSVIDRLVNEYGIGYFKFDYNVSPGAGVDSKGSFGEGLLGHNRAYSAWIDAIHKRYPDLILENCSSGGMREDFAQTSRFQVQSTSDQQDLKAYPPIAATAPMMMVPEQAANWAYPNTALSDEENAFSLSTTLLGRYFLSGYINRMSDTQKELIIQSVEAYKQHVQPIVGNSVPFWPSGLPEWNASQISMGLLHDNEALITVWVRESQDRHMTLHIPAFTNKNVEIATIFPLGNQFESWNGTWEAVEGDFILEVPVHETQARTFIITSKE